MINIYYKSSISNQIAKIHIYFNITDDFSKIIFFAICWTSFDHFF